MRPRSSRFSLWMAVAVLCVFAWGLWRIFDSRLQRGGEQAPYSSFSTQPRGARACHDALDALQRLECRRNLVPLPRFKGAPAATLLFAGAANGFFSEDTVDNFEMVEAWIEAGMDVVATIDAAGLEKQSFDEKKAYLNPWDTLENGVEADPDSKDAKPKSKPKSKDLKRLLRGEVDPTDDEKPRKDGDDAGDADEESTLTLAERWNFKFRYQKATETDIQTGWPVTLDGPDSSVEAPMWRSPWSLEAPPDVWKTLARQGGRAVILRREFGKGSVTLVTDSTFLTNEALARAPAPDFLLWLLGKRDRLIFDETMHGNSEDPGVVALMRRYGLTGFFAGLALFLALLIWRSANSLVPPPDHDLGPDGAVAGAAGSSGLINLMQQAVPLKGLIPACFQEWAKSPDVRRRYNDAVVHAVGALSAEKSGGSSVVELYRKIAAYLASTRG